MKSTVYEAKPPKSGGKWSAHLDRRVRFLGKRQVVDDQAGAPFVLNGEMKVAHLPLSLLNSTHGFIRDTTTHAQPCWK